MVLTVHVVLHLLWRVSPVILISPAVSGCLLARQGFFIVLALATPKIVASAEQLYLRHVST
jgi:hypothetical protein